MSNLLALPLVTLQVLTGTNEDWLDAIKFVVDDGSGGDPSAMPQLDLTGIRFSMEVRRELPDTEVVIRASTDDGSLAIGEPPDFGFLLINISHEQMKIIRPGNYVGDIIGEDGAATRRAIVIALQIAYGITRP
jgi:hypothetical protein